MPAESNVMTMNDDPAFVPDEHPVGDCKVATMDEDQALLEADRLMGELKPSSSLEVKETAMAKLLSLFTQFPSLTCRELKECWNETPLLHLLWIDVSIESFKACCTTCPNFLRQLSTKTGWENYPIHRSCMFSESDEIPLFLAQQAPGILAKYDQSNDLPIHIAMRRKRSSAFLHELMKLCPATVTVNRTLHIALEMPSRLEVLCCIVKTYPEGEKTLSIGPEANTEPLRLTCPQIAIICKLLPRLETLILDTLWEDNEAFLFLVSKVQKNQSIGRIYCLALPSLSGETHHLQARIHDAFQECLNINTKLKVLHLSLPSEGCVSVKKWIDTTLAALATNKGIEEFSLAIGNNKNCSDAPEIMATAPNCLNMLKEHNKTLTSCFPWQSTVWESKDELQFYLELNRLGRSQAINADAAKMAGLLLNRELRGVGFRWSARQRKSTKDLFVESIAYGLLRETPVSWCTPAAAPSPRRSSRSRKRKSPFAYCDPDEDGIL